MKTPEKTTYEKITKKNRCGDRVGKENTKTNMNNKSLPNNKFSEDELNLASKQIKCKS